ncbi:MAG: sensor domain-containing diguanylate cyclase [Eubacteriales bacterium]|nr:sensor domain-containing diguanylate cyclase [Eubacteriales bacterium]
MDLKTIFIVNVIFYIVSMGTLISLWFRNRIRYQGILLWAAHAGLTACGVIFVSVRSVFPEIWAIVLTNLLIYGALFLLLRGFELFFEQPPRSYYSLILLAGLFLLTMYYAIYQPALYMRQLLLSVAAAFILFQIVWLLIFQRSLRPRKSGFPIMITLIAMGSLHLVRIAVNIMCSPKPLTYFENGPTEAVIMLINAMLLVTFTFNETVLISQRLVSEIAAEEQKFNALFNYAPYSIVLTRTRDNRILAVNESFTHMSGYRREQLVGRRALDLGLWADPGLREKVFSQLEIDKPIDNIELMLRHRNGELFPVLMSATLVNIGGEWHIVSNLKDISDVVELRGKLEKLATHDPLTHLPNRNLFDDRFSIARAQAVRANTKFAIAILDLDDFKQVNDRFGHLIGDKALIAVAERAGRYLRLSDTVARFGGDEFVILLNNVQNRAAARETFLRLVEQYQHPITAEGNSIDIHISMGAAIYPDDAESLDDLIRKADHALYQVKWHGKNDVQFFNSDKSTGNLEKSDYN